MKPDFNADSDDIMSKLSKITANISGGCFSSRQTHSYRPNIFVQLNYMVTSRKLKMHLEQKNIDKWLLYSLNTKMNELFVVHFASLLISFSSRKYQPANLPSESLLTRRYWRQTPNLTDLTTFVNKVMLVSQYHQEFIPEFTQDSQNCVLANQSKHTTDSKQI